MTAAAPEPGTDDGWSSVRAAIGRSRFLAAVRTLRDSTRRLEWYRSSMTWRILRRSERVASAAFESSIAARSGRRLGEWTRTSAIYRWLTREPEPEVIVIDLRETVTTGPVIAGLDRLGDLLRPAVRRSRLVRAAAAAEGEFRRRPVRATSWAVLVGAIVTLGLSLVGGRPARHELVLHAAIITIAALGTRVTTPRAELRDARTIRMLAAVLQPPEAVDQTSRTADEEKRLGTDKDRE